MNLLQRSDEWEAERVGKITASRIKDLKAKPQKGKALNSTMLSLLAERLTGKIEEVRVNAAMQWGIDHEPDAIAAYENITGAFVVGCGLINHPRIPMSGASPDGLIGQYGLLEVKCPNTTTHLNTILTNKVPDEYLPQIAWQMACTKRFWCDFVSHDPRVPKSMQTVIIRVFFADVDTQSLERDVIECNKALDDAIAKLTA